MRVDPTNANDFVVHMKDGTTVHFSGGLSTLGSGGTPHVFSSIVDRNGNTIQSTLTNGQLTAITDTVGRTFTFDLTNHNISYKDANGTARTITFTQLTDTSGGSITFTHPLGSDCGANITYPPNGGLFSGHNSTWAITVPNGASGLTYQIQLNVLGEVIKITYPSGGYTRYDYQPYVSSYSVPGVAINCTQVDFREVVAKHECRLAGGNCGPSPAPAPEDTTTYTATIANQANQYMDVLRPDPSGTPNKTHYEFTVPNPLLLEYASLELNRYIYSGSSTLLRTIHTDYNQISISGQPTYFDGSVPIRVTTTLNDVSPNIESKIETDYDSAALTNHWTNYQSPIPISNPTEVREYDYGLVLRRKTDATWLKTGEYAFAQKHIMDLSVVTTITDGGGNQAAQTTNEYDNYTEGISSSDATQLQSQDNFRGNLTAISRWLNTNGTVVTTRNQYDDAGSVRKIVDPNLNSTTISQADSWLNNSCAPSIGQAAAYPTSIINALGQVLEFTYDSCSGSVASSKDQNDVNASRAGITYSYDALGRAIQVNYPDGGQTTNCFTDAGGSTCTQSGPPFQVVTTRIASPSPTVTTAIVYDGLDRVTQAQASDPEGVDYIDTTYDSLGRAATASNPHRSTSNPTDGLTAYLYDALNRTRSVTAQDGSVTTTSYSGNCTTVTDPATKKRTACSDALGRLTQVTEDPGGLGYVTTYSYDALDDLTNVVQNGSRQRTFAYNSLSQLTQAINPESGTVNYTYDANGNMLTKKDARSITTTYSYDALNRVTQKSYSDGTTAAAYFLYDQNSRWGINLTNTTGRLVEEWTGTGCCATGGAEIFGYDPMGRLVYNNQYTVAMGNLGLSYTYDLAGNSLTASNGVGVTFSYAYDTAGRAVGVTSSLVDSYHPATLATVDPSVGYYPTGAIRKMTYGNGLTEAVSLQPRLQPCRINLNSSGAYVTDVCSDGRISGTVQDYDYAYGSWGTTNNGNVTVMDALGTQNFGRSYTYDSINRIATMSAPGDSCSGLSWTFDSWGNRTSQTATGGSCYQQPSTTFSANNQLPPPYQYDAAGDMTYDGSHTYFYDAENHMVQVDGTFGTCSTATACYLYDALGHRSEKQTGSSSISYVHDSAGDVVTEWCANCSGFTGPTTEYISLSGNPVAEYKNSTTYFVHGDHLGSTRLLTGLNQAVVQNLDYLPYGELISTDTDIDTHKFTGKERDSESGLDNFGARYDSSSMGRFMSPDPVYIEGNRLFDPQSLNLYSYVRNNPLNLTDPTGMLVDVNCQQVSAAQCSQTVTDFNNREGAQFQVTRDDKTGQLNVNGDVDPTKLSGGERALYDSITNKDATGTVTVVGNDSSFDFEKSTGKGQNSVDRSDLNALNGADKRLSGEIIAHAALESYDSAKPGVSVDQAHDFAKQFFGFQYDTFKVGGYANGRVNTLNLNWRAVRLHVDFKTTLTLKTPIPLVTLRGMTTTPPRDVTNVTILPPEK
ncbi:MAG: RHS repeat-associated core domain-containing protein [Candidatus Acidiferrum sp.]